MVEAIPTELPEVKIVRARKFEDPRGYFSETYNQRAFAAAGIDVSFVQDNQSCSRPVGTVRGLHFQTRPRGQGKLVRVLKGRILDVAVDLRVDSPRYGRHVAVELDAANGLQLYIPIGFAHGFCTLEPDTEVFYKVTDYYAPEHDRGLLWNDPDLGIDWPVDASAAVLSEKDARQPRLRDLPAYFRMTD